MYTLRSRLEERIQAKHLLTHPFYVRWQTGQLSREELQGYAKEYYAFEREFPRFLSSIHSKVDDISMRQKLLDNLVDEERGEENHPELWLRFAEALGLTREEVKGHFHSDETEHLLRVFRKHSSSGDVSDGLTALYSYERQQPDVVRQKVEGLKQFYGVTEERAVQFFKAHQTYDVYHAEAEYNILSDICKDQAQEEKAITVADETLSALHDFLDGVERRYQRPTQPAASKVVSDFTADDL